MKPTIIHNYRRWANVIFICWMHSLGLFTRRFWMPIDGSNFPVWMSKPLFNCNISQKPNELLPFHGSFGIRITVTSIQSRTMKDYDFPFSFRIVTMTNANGYLIGLDYSIVLPLNLFVQKKKTEAQQLTNTIGKCMICRMANTKYGNI